MFSMFRDADQMETAEEQLIAMLASCQDTFELGAGAVLVRSMSPRQETNSVELTVI